ncbi:hypothetical protein K457DRAFT_12447 [Linnemannia elongata AG-77]|uniref:Uncharacterized protein n=1 Tax=Linnemannia elongata AG-77 TaxID=1314771 RepID=A0A197KKN8_9FUNG|nr:hypothetical protein K457DRAFT_12447 [Linnemannia elongata AG-77]
MNGPKGEQEQKFRMGEHTIKIEPQWDGKIHYHRMNEILDAFPTAVGFEIDGDALDFLTKDNGDLCIPPIIGHYPNRIIDVVPGAPQGSSARPRGPQAVIMPASYVQLDLNFWVPARSRSPISVVVGATVPGGI